MSISPLRSVGAFLRAFRVERKEDPFVTSVEAAFMRALGARDPDIRGSDVLAYQFLTLKYRIGLLLGGVARWLCERISPGGYGYHNARTKFFDAVMEGAIDDGIEQLVLLGAGNDSRAYRMQRLARVRVFEVDLPRTQERKRRLLDEIYGRLPPNVTFVGVDFERDPLESRLREAGFDPSRKTLFSWEGVSFYIRREAVDQVLQTIVRLSPSGGSLVFDYSLRSYTERRDLGTYGGQQLARWLDEHGVRHYFGAEPLEMASILNGSGFEVVCDLGPVELEGYLQGGRKRSTWRVWGNFRVVHARTVARLGR